MALITLKASPCTFQSRGNGVITRTHKLLDAPLATQVVSLKTCSEIQQALQAFSSRVAEEHAGSHYAFASLGRGERAPAGFRKQRFEVEHVVCTTSLATAA